MLWLFAQLDLSWAVEMELWMDDFDRLVHHAIIWRSLERGEGSAGRYGNVKESGRILCNSYVHAT